MSDTPIPEWALFLADDVQNEMLMSEERHRYIIALAARDKEAHARGLAEGEAAGVVKERERVVAFITKRAGDLRKSDAFRFGAGNLAAAIRKGEQ